MLRIDNYKDITSENPIKEVWKLLKYFQDDNFTIKKHLYFQSVSKEEYKKDGSTAPFMLVF